MWMRQTATKMINMNKLAGAQRWTLCSFAYSLRLQKYTEFIWCATTDIGCYLMFACARLLLHLRRSGPKGRNGEKKKHWQNTHKIAPVKCKPHKTWAQINGKLFTKFGSFGIRTVIFYSKSSPLRLSKSLASFSTNRTTRQRRILVAEPIVYTHSTSSIPALRIHLLFVNAPKEQFDEFINYSVYSMRNTATKEAHTEFVDDFFFFSLSLSGSLVRPLGSFATIQRFSDGQQQIICLLRNIAHMKINQFWIDKNAFDQIDNNEKWHSVRDTRPRPSFIHSHVPSER